MREALQLFHPTKRNTVHTIENPKHRYSDGGYWCNICTGIKHLGKATHLWLGPNGDCLVSQGVWEEIQRAGDNTVQLIGSTARPPALTIGRAPLRNVQDNANRKITVFRSVSQFTKNQQWADTRSKAS